MTATQNVNVPYSPVVLMIPATNARGATWMLASAMGWVIGIFKALGMLMVERLKGGCAGLAEAVVDMKETVKKRKSRPAEVKRDTGTGICVTPHALKVPAAWRRAG